MNAKMIGHYVLLERIGRGGTSLIYRAQDTANGRIVAVKVLRSDHLEDASYRARFQDEAHTLKMLHHPNIVSLLDTGEQDGQPYIVLEYIEGQTLKECIEEQGPLPAHSVFKYMRQLLDALAYAHYQGLVHRDVKPQNIFICKDDTVKLSDFGIAQPVDAQQTDEKKVLGTVHYISPEQAQGKTLDGRADVYALGVTLFEMLTGRLPFDQDNALRIALRHVREQVPAPKTINPQVPQALSDIVLRATRRDREKRYANAGEMLSDVIRAKKNPDGHFVKVPHQSPIQLEENEEMLAEPPARPSTLKKKLLSVVGVVILLAALALILYCMVVFTSDNDPANLRQVPNLVGQTQASAEQMISDLGLQASVVLQADAPAPEGAVFEQDPAAGTQVKNGSVVRVQVSSGQRLIVMEDMTGWSQAEAVDWINRSGLQLGSTIKEPSGQPEGQVIRQNPGAGQTVEPDTTVDIWITAPVVTTEGGTL